MSKANTISTTSAEKDRVTHPIIRQEGTITVRKEHDKNGVPTGHAFYRCEECGAEIMTGAGKDLLPHNDDCPGVEGDR
jgi:hypothetical protein